MGGLSRPQDGLVYGVYIDGILCAVESLQIDMPIKDIPSMSFEVAATYGDRKAVNMDSENELQKMALRASIAKYKRIISDGQKVDTEGNPTIESALELAEAKRNLTLAENELKIKTALPPSLLTKNITWRHLRPNAKVHVLFRDVNWEGVVRFAVFFEGEIMSKGFTRSLGARNARFQAFHITQGLDFTSLQILDGAGLTQETVEQNAQGDGKVQTFDITGSFLAKFSPDFISKQSGIPMEQLDIYNFCKEALNAFNSEINNSSVRNNYYAKAMNFYDLANRMYDPNNGLSRLKWAEMYSFILEYVFKNLMPTLGSEISYMNLISYMTEVFLHEFVVHPACSDINNQILIKPINVFMPVPTCNIIFPLHGANYNHSESYRNKPTRHTLELSPPYGKKIDPLTQYYKVISPKQLRDKVADSYGLTAEQISKMDNITDEEAEVGVIPSYNNIPAIITSLLEMMSTTDSAGNILKNPKLVKGAGEDFSESETNTSTMSGSNLTDDQIRAIEAKLYVHKKLLVVEGLAKAGEKITDQKSAELNTAISGEFRYVPNRVTIVPVEKMTNLSEAVKNKKKVNYSIKDGVVKRVLGREFHVFEEPTDAIPLMIRIKEDDARLQSINKQNKFFVGGDKVKGKGLEKTYKLEKSIDRRKHTQTMIPYLSGGFHQSIVIAIDEKENSRAVLADLLACVCQLCDIPLNTAEKSGNVRVLSDYYGESFVTQNVDKELKNVIENARRKQDSIKKEVDGILKTASASKGSGNSTASSKSGMDKKLKAILEVNEAGGEAKYRINYNPNTPEFDFGGAQFVISKSTIHSSWGKFGFTSAETRRLQNMLHYAPKPLSAFSNGDRNFIESLNGKLRSNKDRVNVLDDEERKLLIAHTVSQIRKYFYNNLFEGYSIFGQLCDIYNQWGTHTLDNYKNTIPLFITDGKVTKSNVLKWRYASADHPKSSVSRADQKRRYDNIESKYGEAEGKYITAEELIKSITSSIDLTANLKSSGSVKSSGTSEGSSTDTVNNSSASDDYNTEDSPNISEINIKSLNERYSIAVGDFYFYCNRYKNNRDSLNIAFDPYLFPGFSALLLDSSELRSHCLGYLERVTYSQHSSGQLGTQVQLGYLRSADELGLARDLELTHGLLKDGTLPKGVPEILKESVPFFGGEYAEENIQATFERVLGCGKLNLDPIPEEFLKQKDLTEANKSIRRRMQYCKMVDAGDKQNEYDALYNANPSAIAAVFNGYDFPEEIHLIKDIRFVSSIVSYSELLATDAIGEQLNVVDSLAFNESTRELVRNHNSIIRYKQPQRG